MRLYDSKDLAPQNACVTVKMFETTHSAKYGNCKVREDLPYENGQIYSLVPLERLAADAVLEICGIVDVNSDVYKASYMKAVNYVLNKNVAEPISRLSASDMPQQQKKNISDSLKVVDTYQKELKKRGLDLLEPFDVASSFPTRQSEANEGAAKEKTSLDLLISFIETKPQKSNVELFFESLMNEPQAGKTEPVVEEKAPPAPNFPLPPVNVTPYRPEADTHTPANNTAVPNVTESGVPIEFEEEAELTLEQIMTQDSIGEKKEDTITVEADSAPAVHQPDATKPVVSEPTAPEQDTNVNDKPNESAASKKDEGFTEVDFASLLTVDDLFASEPKKNSNDNGNDVKKPDVSEPVQTPVEPETSQAGTEKEEKQQGFTIEPIEDIDDDDDEDDIYAGLFN